MCMSKAIGRSDHFAIPTTILNNTQPPQRDVKPSAQSTRSKHSGACYLGRIIAPVCPRATKYSFKPNHVADEWSGGEGIIAALPPCVW